jgi:Zn-dependent alcohol dehydrogenase
MAVNPSHIVAATASLSAVLALISSLAPQNEVQAALAVHIACLHMASLRVLARMPLNGENKIVAMATAAYKLDRAFQEGIDRYYRLQRGAVQIVRIERVEVQAGAQAVVGVVGSK